MASTYCRLEDKYVLQERFPGIPIFLVSLHLNLFGRVLHLFCLIELNTICLLRFMKGNRRDINLARSIKNQPLM